MKKIKIEPAVALEVAGLSLVTVGIAMFSLPVSLIALGAILIWLTEKAE
jgi:hypothetical protein